MAKLKCYMDDKQNAVALAPQLNTRVEIEMVSGCGTSYGKQRVEQGFTFAGQRFVYLPVCACHLDGWWDGSDVAKSHRPPTIPILKE